MVIAKHKAHFNPVFILGLLWVMANPLSQAACPPGDLDRDCRVDMRDLAILSGYWMMDHPPVDLDGSAGLGLADVAVLANTWLVQKDYAVISEFLASNHDTQLDEDGDSSDWIELYNPTRSEMSLDGWYLTDDRDRLTQWKLPAVTLQAGEFLTVFASGKDRASPGSQLHTNFQLSTEDTYLALVESDRKTVAS